MMTNLNFSSEKGVIQMEIWKDISGYEGLYQASTCGRIRSMDRTTPSKRWNSGRTWHGVVLKPKRDGQNVLRVGLWKEGSVKHFLLARLVAQTFLGDPPEGYTVNHIDGNRLNNSIENLEWLSLADNIKHGFRTGLYKKNQKAITLLKDGNSVSFSSYSEADRYLGRKNGYVSNCIKQGRLMTSADGSVYEPSRKNAG